MDFFSVDEPPPDVTFELAGDDETGSDHFETITDEDFLDACLASADLRELGLPEVSTAVGWRAWRKAKYFFEEFRAARSAVDTSTRRLETAGFRLVQATRQALTGPLDRDAAEEGRK